ncbi:electron transport complex protein RnfC [Natronobacillus azotifigens]|uniref:Ion-translocating oxidoreductase complex subunit C n=1 Tax=Natronobacillus azotifigens TaxID=472978 RepID=A0A9J6R9B8_9BACI|nr:electron transport complex subunit RsxC [Natronobacillus azotifigens]MCZ0702232.1 electron transport complex subunit RsxC [Natronobacillus azotifigens]
MFLLKGKREGAQTEERKHRTEHRPIEEASVPSTLIYPLSMHIGAPATPLVEEGDKVKIGTLIAEKAGFVSANIYSSVSGEVIEISDMNTTNGKGPCIAIKNDFQDEWDEPLFNEGEELDRERKLKIIEKAGIVGMGGATFPTSVKLSPPPEKKIDTLIINGAECEPYSTADHRLMVEYAKELIEGVRVLLEIVSATNVYIAVESNGHESVEALKKAIGDSDYIQVKELPTIYPQGSEKNLIKNLTGREVPPGGLPADVHVMLMNVATTYAVYEAVRLGKPLTKRITTVSGEPIKDPKNLWVRIGTPIEELIKECDGFQSAPGKMIHGGPMMGKPITSGRVPVTKGTSVITFLEPEEVTTDERTACIRCSECLNVCPVSLQPILISNAYENGDIDQAEQLGAMDCIDCGNCSYICPSKIPILDNIRSAKIEIRSRKEKK